MSCADRWMRALLMLYPRGFRQRFGAEMRSTFAESFHERHAPFARLKLLLASLADAVRTAAGEWRDVVTTFRPVRSMLADWSYALRHAARALLRNPGFTLAATLTLAVGIGATTAVFSVMSNALLEPLPYPNANRLAVISETKKGDEISVSWLNFRDFQARARGFESIAGFYGQSMTYTGGGEPERMRGEVVTANLFSTLGVRPILGHEFAERDDEEGARVVALSHATWTQKFGADSGVIGRTIVLNGEPFTVTAVMPPGFRFPDGITYGPADLWVSMSLLDSGDRTSRDNHAGIVGVGLLKRGMPLTQGREELTSIAAALAREYPETNRDQSVSVQNAVDAIVGPLAKTLKLLFAAALVVLLIACANVGGLLLTRADARRRELAIKVALGADGVRVAANLAGEAILLAVGGGVAGTALAFALVRAFGGSVASLPRLETLAVDPRALMFSALLSIAIALVCSFIPLAWARARDTQQSLQARGAAGSLATRTRNAFVVGQVALSLVLLVTATLLLRTFQAIAQSDGGIRPDGVATFILQLPDSRYNDAAARSAFVRRLSERMQTLPGVTSAAAISVLPFSGSGAQSGVAPVGGTREQERRTDMAAITPDYFRTMGVSLVRGRVFSAHDDEQAARVAIVDERFAAAMWPGSDAIGKRVAGWGVAEWTIVGVVKHVKNYGVTAESRQEMYVPFAQRPLYRLWGVMRADVDPAKVIASVRGVVKELDAQLPVYGVRTMREVVDQTVIGPRLAAFLSAGYALTALLVVIIGIHGAIAYVVHRRTREIGVRVALGATERGVLGLVIGQSARLTGAGVLIGIAGALGVARMLREQLFGIAATDPLTLVIAAAGMLVIGTVASAIPAWRATRVSPLVALNDD